MKILLLDIETSPNLGWVWGLFKQNIAINQIEQSGSILCWAAKWLGDDRVMFGSSQRSSEKNMLSRIHRLVDEADAIVHYNGKSFDLPTLNREWLKHGFLPPAPAKQIDLYLTVKSKFRFLSNKFDYVTQYLGIGRKVEHAGFKLWKECMEGKKAAWKKMEEYNKQDVLMLEPTYYRLLPWMTDHPSHSAKDGDACCPKCGSYSFQQRGYAQTAMHKYRRYQCKDCGGWFRGNKTVLPRTKGERMVNIAA